MHIIVPGDVKGRIGPMEPMGLIRPKRTDGGRGAAGARRAEPPEHASGLCFERLSFLHFERQSFKRQSFERRCRTMRTNNQALDAIPDIA